MCFFFIFESLCEGVLRKGIFVFRNFNIFIIIVIGRKIETMSLERLKVFVKFVGYLAELDLI